VRHPGRTPPFRTVAGEILPGSIAELGYHRLGGVDQWVMIRGESLTNPPLIHLHGGPGFSETRPFRHFNASLERSFTVVYWDQRGAGKSFARNIERSSMTVEQFIADLDELVDAVRIRVGMDKVAIFGHSWGSVLGVLYAARFPQKVAAYVGSGQIGDWPAAESASYAFVLAEARTLEGARLVRRIRTCAVRGRTCQVQSHDWPNGFGQSSPIESHSSAEEHGDRGKVHQDRTDEDLAVSVVQRAAGQTRSLHHGGQNHAWSGQTAKNGGVRVFLPGYRGLGFQTQSAETR
jgi:dienelactone hydrolase